MTTAIVAWNIGRTETAKMQTIKRYIDKQIVMPLNSANNVGIKSNINCDMN